MPRSQERRPQKPLLPAFQRLSGWFLILVCLAWGLIGLLCALYLAPWMVILIALAAITVWLPADRTTSTAAATRRDLRSSM